MQVSDFTSPKSIVQLDVLEENIMEIAELCRDNNKELWPMVKTHKSTYIADLQLKYGAVGFLTGTVDEAEKLIDYGIKRIMLAYPVAGKSNIERVITLAKKAKVILSLDGIEAAKQINDILKGHKMFMEYLLVIDSGLHRFGVSSEDALLLANEINELKSLKLIGISTHPGHVYKATNSDEVKLAALDEINALTTVKKELTENGYDIDIVATGSTPTLKYILDCKEINVIRPGNYVFYDNIQTSLGIVDEKRCALTVMATITAHHDDYFVMDAGSKCLGLDKGAHGNSLIKGFGVVKGHPELIIEGLSEEVGKIKILAPTSLHIGDKINIVPNHSCSAANMTSYLLGVRDNKFEKLIDIDMRGNSLISNIT